ncbi:penicillin-binding transpeptidase domain-containing protein [uncultured Corynebacterium sp.]|uniref:penicillin-binding transpeptidase domain-containing protein n=1 Tax=uncultured Corynebacterium sp. TaxID=159447 RepID=UPI0025E0A485|nr:penicillin-binding transpeptidase domain-containing protein [uncultured Corynebacterium sp.]
MNKSIRQVLLFSIVLIVLLLANLTWVQAFRTEQYAENPLNTRQFLEEKSRNRGQISAGGEILARSELGENGYYDRVYEANPEAYAPVEGYLSDIYGASGLEQSQNSILNGTDPSLFASRAIDTITGSQQSGANLELTLIPEAQETAYRALADNGYVGSAVALRPSTGEVLAMASTPSYDPNDIAANDSDEWARLNADEDAPLLNHATQRPLPPGSTFKVLTTIAAVENGAGPGTPVTGASEITLPGTNTTLENYGGQSCGGTTTLQVAFARSCNTAFAEIAVETGADPLRDVAERMGVGEEYDELGLPQDESTLGEIPDDAALAQTAIGQRDVSFTPLQNAIVAATIANDGVRMEPHLIKTIQGQDLSPLETIEPEEINEAIHPDTAEMLTEFMRASESNSGGNGSAIASKTGTAEHGSERGALPPHVWYIAFAPDSDVAVAVVVESGGGQGSSATGASVAAPVGREIIAAVERSVR